MYLHAGTTGGGGFTPAFFSGACQLGPRPAACGMAAWQCGVMLRRGIAVWHCGEPRRGCGHRAAEGHGEAGPRRAEGEVREAKAAERRALDMGFGRVASE